MNFNNFFELKIFQHARSKYVPGGKIFQYPKVVYYFRQKTVDKKLEQNKVLIFLLYHQEMLINMNF